MNTIPQKIGIAGFGMEGRAVYDYYKGKAEIHIFDERSISLEGVEANSHIGLDIPGDIPVLYKSPGIPARKIRCASSQTRITTFMDLVLEQVGARTIGVTGTKGKSTITALIHHVLTEVGENAVLFGNIGIADAGVLMSDESTRRYVTELSSYQCEYLTHSPHLAVLSNLYSEHLSHHGSLEVYREAKLNIARFQKPSDIFVNGAGIETAFAGKVVIPNYSLHFETRLIGEHNQRNCAIAFAALSATGISEEAARKHIATFAPLPYRLEMIGVHRGITFYDDSLATIPEATLASLNALPRVDTLLLGGEDRGISFDEMAEKLSTSTVQNFIIFPDTGLRMVARVGKRTIVPVASMREAVAAAYAHTPEGGTVLLSNASPSFNLFKDYTDKSAQYRSAVEELGA